MAYLRLTWPALDPERRRGIAEHLSAAVVDPFTPPRGPSAADLRSRGNSRSVVQTSVCLPTAADRRQLSRAGQRPYVVRYAGRSEWEVQHDGTSTIRHSARATEPGSIDQWR